MQGERAVAEQAAASVHISRGAAGLPGRRGEDWAADRCGQPRVRLLGYRAVLPQGAKSVSAVRSADRGGGFWVRLGGPAGADYAQTLRRA